MNKGNMGSPSIGTYPTGGYIGNSGAGGFYGIHPIGGVIKGNMGGTGICKGVVPVGGFVGNIPTGGCYGTYPIGG